MSKIAVFSQKSIDLSKRIVPGPSIRPLEIAKALSGKGHEVDLFLPEIEKDFLADGFREILSCYSSSQLTGRSQVRLKTWQNEKNFRQLVLNYDAQILVHEIARFFPDFDFIPTIVDLYDPSLVSDLTGLIDPLSYPQAYFHAFKLHSLILALKKGDFFICAGSRQRFYYLGMLQLLGRLTPSIAVNTEKLLKIVPIGAPGVIPVKTKRLAKGVLFDENSEMLLWASGIYPHFNANTLLNAFKKLVVTRENVFLVFLGALNPNAEEYRKGYDEIFKRAKELELLDRRIFFIPWLPYTERADIYLEADLAVCMTPFHLESELCFRNRIIDLLWAGVPVVTISGSDLAQDIKSSNAGFLLETGEADELENAIKLLLQDRQKLKSMGRNAREMIQNKYTWDKVVEPVNEFCMEPGKAADKSDRVVKDTLGSVLKLNVKNYLGFRNRLIISVKYRGFWGFLKRITDKMR